MSMKETYGLSIVSHSISYELCGLGHEGAAVLLPSFAIIW